MNMFFSGTDEDMTHEPKAKGKRSITYKEDVVAALIHNHDIPFRTAELAVIDLRHMLNQGYHSKLTPAETAYTMLERIEQVYRVKARVAQRESGEL